VQPFQRNARRHPSLPESPRCSASAHAAARPARPAVRRMSQKTTPTQSFELGGENSERFPCSTHRARSAAVAGRPLDPAVGAFMESRFGHDFSQVRVHTDARAAESARAVNALAYTVGTNVVFAAQQYSPREALGRQLLADPLPSSGLSKEKAAAVPSSTTIWLMRRTRPRTRTSTSRVCPLTSLSRY
jgi:Domain of unknown function (DUF4157)